MIQFRISRFESKKEFMSVKWVLPKLHQGNIDSTSASVSRFEQKLGKSDLGARLKRSV